MPMEPDTQESKQRYDSWHQAMADGERGETAPPLHPWHVTTLKLLPDLNSCDVLEVGCGRGDFTIELARRFPKARITGVDFSPKAIEVANLRKEAARTDADFLVCDAQALPFPSQSFDWIVSC